MIDYPVVTGFLKTLFPGIPVILRDQNAQAPELPYVTWFEMVNVSKSRPESVYVNRIGTQNSGSFVFSELESGEVPPNTGFSTLPDGSDGGTFISFDQYTEKITQNKVSTIQIDVYNETISQSVIKEIQNYVQAGELADSAILRTSTFNSQAYQRTNDIGVLDWTDPSRFSRFLGDNSEAHAMMELKLNNTQTLEENAIAIDTDTIDINLSLQ